MGLPIINLSLVPTFPARVFGSGPIVITKAGLDYTFSWDASTYSINPVPSGMSYVLSYDPSTGATELIPVSGVAADWDSIVNKPATFPPSAHTHPISQVDGLQTALDDKLDDSQAGTFGLTLLSQTSATNARTALALVPGTDVQAYDPDLSSIGSISTTNVIPYRSAANTWGTVTIGSGLSLVSGTLSATGGTVSAGSIINSVSAEYTTFTGFSVTIPTDDTIPQSSEGTQLLSVSITPSSATNKLRARYMFWAAASSIGVAALFNGGANAIQVTAGTMSTGSLMPFSGEVEITAGTTSAVTISLRVGAQSGTMYVNGIITPSRLFGGASRAVLVVEEIKV